MTEQERRNMRKIYGESWDEIDIPTYIRMRDFKKEMDLIDALERKAEEVGEELKNEQEK